MLGKAKHSKAKHSKAKQTANTNGTKIWSKKERGLAPLFPTNHPTPVRSNFTSLHHLTKHNQFPHKTFLSSAI